MAAIAVLDAEGAVARGTRPCAGCGAPMYWLTTVACKRMPMDAVVVVEAGADGQPDRIDGTLSHWASCVNRDQFRRAK
jgi:hypothetical protein